MTTFNLLYNHVPKRVLRVIYHRCIPAGWSFPIHNPILYAYMNEYEADRLLRKLDPTMNPDVYYCEVYK